MITSHEIIQKRSNCSLCVRHGYFWIFTVVSSQIEISITQSELLSEDEKGAKYNIELKFVNPSLLLLTVGETEFFVIINDEMVGKGQLESFTLQPLESSNVKGIFYTDSNNDESKSVKITGTYEV